MVIFLLILILAVLLVGRRAFLRSFGSVAVGLVVYTALIVGCISTLVLVVELAVWAGSTAGAQSFTQWFWKHSVFTLWLPGSLVLVWLLASIIQARRSHGDI
jgi:hypothetical protein